MTHSILIVDDHAGFRRSARALLEAEGFDVVGEAATGRAALVEVERLHPRVVLLDIQLPDLDGFAVVSALAATTRPPVIILISSRDRGSYEPQLATADVLGFIPKSRLSGAAVRELTG
ncbi:MAG: response regulator transcription factor [Chloroflexi bacterium]|nr:response regulator transcription factor [Chloroflexota bacterium]